MLQKAHVDITKVYFYTLLFYWMLHETYSIILQREFSIIESDIKQFYIFYNIASIDFEFCSSYFSMLE